MSTNDRPSNAEEEFFARENAERLRKIAVEKQQQMAAAERDNIRKAHWMRCPKCGMELKEVEYRGVKVDQCFSCNGTFFDAGELEKVVAPEGGAVMKSILNIFGGKK
jgi:uncharacterized protein